MARDRDFLPAMDSKLVTWLTNFQAKITSTPTAFGLTAAMATSNGTLTTSFVNAYAVANAEATRSPMNITLKDMAKQAVVANVRMLSRLVQGTPTVSPAQKQDLGLNPRDVVPSPIPVPNMRPAMDIVSVTGRTVLVRVHDAASSSKRGKPAGTTAAWVYSFVGTSYPSDPTAWSFEGATTKGKFQILFPDSVAGGTQVFVCAAWINGKQEAGPTSMPVSTNLQGGGTSVAPVMKLAA